MSFRDDGGRNGGPWSRMGGPANPLDPFPQEPEPNRRYGLRLIIIFALAALGCVLLFSAYPPSFVRDGDEVYVVQYGLIGVAMLMSLAASRRSLVNMAGQLAAWALIALAIVALYGYRDELRDVGERVLAELVPTRGASAPGGAMVFSRSPDRQFWIDATANGVPVRFLVDTGASGVVLTRADAARLGFDVRKLAFTQYFQTANGRTRGAPVRLNEIRIGALRFPDIEASVNEGELGSSLLGMRLLERLSSIEIRKDRLIIKP